MKTVQHKLMNLEEGECFGEDNICLGVPNSYSVRVESNEVVLYTIDKQKFHKYRKVILEAMKKYFYRRKQLIN